MLDLIEKISLDRWIELVAVVEKTGRRTQDRGKRGSKIMGNRSQEGVAHMLRLGRRSRTHHITRERAAVECRCDLLAKSLEKRPLFRIERHAIRALDPRHSDRRTTASKGNEQPGHSRQDRCPGARRLVRRECPLCGTHCCSVDGGTRRRR